MKRFIIANPVSAAFLRREKGRLPYSVFKATSPDVKFIKSEFKGRPPTAFFTYPSYVTMPQAYSTDLVKSYSRRGDIEYLYMSFLISERTHIYNAVVNTMKTAGFDLLEFGEEFNLIWTGYTTIEDILKLNKYQKINHFPESVNLGRKDLLWRNIYRMRLKFPKQFNIAPHSWILPEEYNEFEDTKAIPAMREKMFILKPCASSQGRGIRVVQGSTEFSNKEETIVSTYVDDPLLIKNKKFDMRMYVVVTSYNPLRIYLYEEGLARFATEDYSNDPATLRNKFAHLTNFSINKRNLKAYVKNDTRGISRTNKGASVERDENEEAGK